MSAACPDDDELGMFVERRLPEARRARVERHCDTCDACQETIALLVDAFAASHTDDRSSGRPTPGHGTTLGRYVILAWIGAGGMGSVYAAFDPELDRRVALKLLAAGRGSDLDPRARFLAEARAMARISHPNVIAVHDVGTHGELAFFAMELVDGDTLGQWLSHEPRTTAEILEVFAAAGRGLAAAHAGGLVHRDFKPHNVLVGRDGRVRVIDFGLARLFAGPEDTIEGPPTSSDWHSPHTRPGAVLGTPAYMAPEQLRGDAVDARVDQFAFCVSLYEALVGRRPFDGDDVRSRMASIQAGVVRGVPSTRRLSRRLQRVLERGLAASPLARWPSMDALVEQLTARPLARAGPIAAAVVAVAGVGFGLRGSFEHVAPRCELDPSALAGAWDPARRAAFEKALVGDAPQGSAEATTAAWAIERYDRYAAHWLDTNQAVCAAKVERTSQTTDAADLQLACLRRAKIRMQANLDAALDSPSWQADRIPELVDTLPPLSACDDVAGLASGPRPPTPEQDTIVEAQRDALASAHASLAAASFREAEAQAEAVEQRAREIDYTPLADEAAIVRALATEALGRFDDAAVAFERALAGALASGDRAVSIRAAAGLACLARKQSRAPEVGTTYGNTALSLAAGGDTPAVTRAIALRCMGSAQTKAGDIAAAQTSLREAIAVLEPLATDEAVTIARVQIELGQALLLQRQFVEAQEVLGRAADVLRDELGDDNVLTATAVGELASAVSEQGHDDEAMVLLDRVLAVWIRAEGPRSVNVGIVHAKRGNIEQRRERWTHALHEYGAARDVLEASLGLDHPSTLRMEASMATMAMESGDVAGGRARLRDVLRRFEQVADADHPSVIHVRSALGEAELRLHDTAAVVATLTPAIAACGAREDLPDAVCGDIALLLGRAQLQRGDLDAAREMATETQRRYARIGEEASEELAALVAGVAADH